MENTEVLVENTPIPIIAKVSRIATKVVDQVSGSRADYPILTAFATQACLKIFHIESQLLYGRAAWIEVFEDHTVDWAGNFTEENPHFWVESQFGETIDLNLSIAFRGRARDTFQRKAILSPPMLWSRELPHFCQYFPAGIAELNPSEQNESRWLTEIAQRVNRESESALEKGEADFLNAAIICPGRKLLDDSNQSFAKFDRAISVRGIPPFDLAEK